MVCPCIEYARVVALGRSNKLLLLARADKLLLLARAGSSSTYGGRGCQSWKVVPTNASTDPSSVHSFVIY
eukprot:6397546-Amphidinium_carterae.1